MTVALFQIANSYYYMKEKGYYFMNLSWRLYF
jgi:hypothetical protein